MLEAQEHYHQQSTTLRQAGFHQANQMYEETAEALANLAQATATDRKTLETLTETVATLTLQLKEKKKDTVIKNLNNQIKQLKTGNNDAAADGWYLGPAMHHY